jgi:hypothetical protein
MSRRSVLVQAIRKNKTKQTKTLVICMPVWVTRKGGEPMVLGAPGYRPPTREELIAGIVKAGFTQEVATAAAAKIVAAREKTKPDS